MNKLQDFNNYIFEEYTRIENCEDLSMPLLISSDVDYTNNLERRIMYIGQETNGWVNDYEVDYEINSSVLEQIYISFLRKGATNRDFWLFIRQILEISSEKLINNVIWNNTLLAGKRTEKGHPVVTPKLEDLSLEYLLVTKNIFNPEYIIFVNGPHNPYYNITIKFLKELKSSLINTYPTRNNPLLIDRDNNIIWTYHPNYQHRIGINNEIISKIKNKVK